MEFKKPEAFIDEWTLRDEGGYKWLEGKITGHENQEQFIMTFQSTSAIVREDYANNEVETENTIYKLGKQFIPLPHDHEKQWPPKTYRF